MDDGEIIIDDVVTGAYAVAQARFHLHPQLMLEANASAQAGEGVLPGGRRLSWVVEQGHASLEAGTYHPRFGLSLAGSCLVIRLVQGRSRVRFSWA